MESIFTSNGEFIADFENRTFHFKNDSKTYSFSDLNSFEILEKPNETDILIKLKEQGDTSLKVVYEKTMVKPNPYYLKFKTQQIESFVSLLSAIQNS